MLDGFYSLSYKLSFSIKTEFKYFIISLTSEYLSFYKRDKYKNFIFPKFFTSLFFI